jgi:hypothetical protein
MGRVRFLTVLIISSALVLSAASAQAGWFNRPDILDVSDSSSYTYDGDYDTWVRAFMYADDDWASVWGSMSASGRDGNHIVNVYTQLYQPDNMMRNHRKAKASQKRYMYMMMALRTSPYGSTVDRNSTIVEDCKGSMQADDRDNDGSFDLSPAGDDRIRGKLRCRRDMLEELGFSPNDIDSIEGIIGNRTKMNIRLPR